MTDNCKKSDAAKRRVGAGQPAKLSRRGLLKAGATAMPAVLTLQSGAALAATSAYIGSTSRAGSHVAGHVYCLVVRNAEPLPNGTTFRFVNTNYADVYVLPDGHYHDATGRSPHNPYILSDEFCRVGGSKYLDADSWPQVDLPSNLNGVLVSSTALTSVMAAMDVEKIIP